MPEAHPHRATIPPVTGTEARPLWSVMIPAFNCAGYLRETLQSVLVQDPGPEQMQIEVVDDCSTDDDPEAVVRDVGRGRVCFYRQESNVGHVRNFETCLLRARGELIHLLHGDDRVRPGFYTTLERPFGERPDIGAAFCRHICMDTDAHWLWLGPLLRDEPGVLEGALIRIASRQPVMTPTVVVRRVVYERLGGFDRRMSYCGEDWEMWVRIAANYPVWYEPQPLAEYRRHRVSLTARSIQTAENIRDIRRAVSIYRAYLPPADAARVTRKALELSATWGTGLAGEMLVAGNRRAAVAQVWEALRCSRSPRILSEVASHGINGLSYWARRGIRALGSVATSTTPSEAPHG